MGSCRSLIEFCKAFELHRLRSSQSQAACDIRVATSKGGRRCMSICEQPTAAVLDVFVLALALGACGFLFTPYFKLVCSEVSEILPAALGILREISLAYVLSAALGFALVLVAFEIYQSCSRKCHSPCCRGLRKAVEFDIQLESEEVAKSGPDEPSLKTADLWEDQVELEAELRRMAPLNGRAVLICRKPCGCPTARIEVWGNKKPRKSKK